MTGNNRDDPFASGTILRPQPGRARSRAAGAPAKSEQESADVPPAPPKRPAKANVSFNPNVEQFLPADSNSLARGAGPLLTLVGKLRALIAPPDVTQLREQVVSEIAAWESRSHSAGINRNIFDRARYVLCTALDEAVLSTPWGQDAGWADETLLYKYCRDLEGGEKVFTMLDRLDERSSGDLDLLELIYMCLSLGFQGQYGIEDRGEHSLQQIRDDLYQRLRTQRGYAKERLSIEWQGARDRRNRLIRYVPLWVVAAGAVAILSALYLVFQYRLTSGAEPAQARLALLGLDAFEAPPRNPVALAGPSLKRLLSAEEQAEVLSVSEVGGKTTITLAGARLFASGSANVSADYLAVLDNVAAALQRTPGRIIVIGHTDDVPIRSLRYKDNYELSRERAANIARALMARLGGSSGVEWTGVGPSMPLQEPQNLPENRAVNRRAEIVHIAER